MLIAATAVAAVILLSGTGDEGGPQVVQSPSPTPIGIVRIVSLANGDKVTGGQSVRVAVFADGLSDGTPIRLVVNGSAVGGTETTASSSYLWRPPKAGGRATVQAIATLGGGTFVRSEVVEVRVLPGPTPRPARTVIVGGGGSSSGATAGGDSLSTPFWGAFYSATESRSDADAVAADGRAAGFDILVLNTIDYDSLGDPGQAVWVICAGPYASYSAADAAAAHLRAAGFEGAYAKIVQ